MSKIFKLKMCDNLLCSCIYDFPLKPCSLCNRPAILYGNRDVDTEWVGWCTVCNWHWKHPEIRILSAFRYLRFLPVPSVTAHIVFTYLVGEDLRKLKEKAWYICWFKMLLRGEPDEDSDASEMSDTFVWNPEQFKSRPLWYLQLSATSSGRYGRPFKILTTMLGGPPLSQFEERLIHDHLLQVTYLDMQ